MFVLVGHSNASLCELYSKELFGGGGYSAEDKIMFWLLTGVDKYYVH